MIRWLICSLLITSTFTQGVHAGFSYTATCEQAHEAILKFDFRQADSLILSANDEHNGCLVWIKAYRNFVFHLVSADENTSHIGELLEKSIEDIGEFDKSSPWFYTSQADVYLMLSYCHYSRAEYLQALNNYYQAKRRIEIIATKFPHSDMHQRYQMILYAVDRLITDMWQFTQTYANDATVINRFKEILGQSLASKTLPDAFITEAKLVGLTCYSLIDTSEGGTYQLAESFGEQWAIKGPAEAGLFAAFAIKAGRFNESSHILQKAVMMGFNKQYNRLNLLMGNAFLNQMNDSCVMYLTDFIGRQTNRNDVAYAHLKLCWWYKLRDDKNRFDFHLEKLKKLQFPPTTENEQALYEVTLSGNWDPLLIKARLLFDGGNYEACRDLLLLNQQTISHFNQQQKLEFAYRMARACDKTHQVEFAVRFYQMVVHSQSDNETYYPAYAAYYLGVLYHQQNKPDEARHFFKLCTQLDSPVYKESIHRKAKRYL